MNPNQIRQITFTSHKVSAGRKSRKQTGKFGKWRTRIKQAFWILTIASIFLLIVSSIATVAIAAHEQWKFQITYPKNNGTVPVHNGYITFKGTGTPGATVEWDVNIIHTPRFGFGRHSATVDKNGHWTLTEPVDVPYDRKRFTLKESGEMLAHPQRQTITVKPVVASADNNSTPQNTPAQKTNTAQNQQTTHNNPDTTIKAAHGLISIDTRDIVNKSVAGVESVLGANQTQGWMQQAERTLLANPNYAIANKALQPAHQLVDKFQYVAIALALPLIILAALRVTVLGDKLSKPFFATVVVGLMLGAYNQIWGAMVHISNALVGLITCIAVPAGTKDFVYLVTHLDGPTFFVGAILAIAAVIGLLLIIFMKALGGALLLALYVAGPLCIAAGLLPEIGGAFKFWISHTVKILTWSVMWAILIKIMSAAALGYGVPVFAGNKLFASLSMVAMLVLMFMVPWAHWLYANKVASAVVRSGRAMYKGGSTTRAAAAGGATGGVAAGAVIAGGAVRSGFQRTAQATQSTMNRSNGSGEKQPSQS